MQPATDHPHHPEHAEDPSSPKQPAAAERRRYSRRTTPGLVGRVGFLQRMRVLDLSPSGARISTAESLAPGRRYHFQLAALQLTAEVARCTMVGLEPDEDGARPLFEAGLSFDPLTAAQRRLLRQVTARAAAA